MALGFWWWRVARGVSYLSTYVPRALPFCFSLFGQESFVLTTRPKPGVGSRRDHRWNPQLLLIIFHYSFAIWAFREGFWIAMECAVREICIESAIAGRTLCQKMIQSATSQRWHYLHVFRLHILVMTLLFLQDVSKSRYHIVICCRAIRKDAFVTT